jgi:hypothetical protein
MRGGRGSSLGRAAAKRRLDEARAGQGRMRGTRCGRSARRRGRRRAEEQSESMEDAMPRVQGPEAAEGRGGGGGGGEVFAGGGRMVGVMSAKRFPAEKEGAQIA